MDINAKYSNEYCSEIYRHLMCSECSNNCNKCTLDIKRYYTRYNNADVPTVCYKCSRYKSKELRLTPERKTYLLW